jgi:oligoendopeptidase F
LKIHELVERKIPLTPGLLKEEYQKLDQEYFGPAMADDGEIGIEWARIPHLYYNFYVYQYATGISAALALVERVLSGGKAEREDYLQFLSSGYSRDPLDLLKTAGVDMTSSLPVQSAVRRFGELVDQLKE